MFLVTKNVELASFILLGSAFVGLVLESVGTPVGYRKSGSRTHIAVISLIACIAVSAVFFAAIDLPSQEVGHFIDDPLTRTAVVYLGIISLLALSTTTPILRRIDQERGEIFAVILSIFLLGIVLITATDFIYFAFTGFFLLASFAFLVIFRFSRHLSGEVAIKTAFFAFIFFALALTSVAFAPHNQQFASILILFCGLLFIGISPLAFFHLDYFDGAPLFAAILFGGAIWICGPVALLHLYQAPNLWVQSVFSDPVIILITCLSLILPAIFALDQRRVSRMVIHLLFCQTGVILATILASPQLLLLILQGVALAFPGALFGIHFWKHPKKGDKTWEEYTGAGRKHPLVAAAWLLMLASIAGLPGTAGFYARHVIVKACLEQEYFLLAICVMASIVLALVPVIRLAVMMFAKPTGHELATLHQPKQTAIILLLGIATILLGLVPNLPSLVLETLKQ